MTKRLAFFGATGGCTTACLSAALKAGYHCTALARTPSKLENALHARGLGDASLHSHLTIIAGDVRDVEAVKKTITSADIIITGLGAYPIWRWSLWKPLTTTDNTICTDGVTSILNACQALHENPSPAHSKPTLIAISTAGVQEKDKARAQPLIYLAWYDWLLADPLADKVAMEKVILSHAKLPENERGVEGYVIVKPSILTDGKHDRLKNVRAGTGEAPPIGYMIDRKMVGLWIWRALIEEGGAWGQWKNGRVTITY